MTRLFSDAKGQFAQSLVISLLEAAGYRVQRFGVEEVLSEVKSVSNRGEGYLDLPPALWALPDLLVLNLGTSAAGLVEVKFRTTFDDRTARELHAALGAQQRHWPGTHTVLVVADPPGWPGGRYQDYLRVIRPDDLRALSPSTPAAEGWARLSAFGSVFVRAQTADGFHAEADRLVPVIRAWATDRDTGR